MELGLGFLMGALAGAIGGIIVVAIISASRRAVKNRQTKVVPKAPPADVPPSGNSSQGRSAVVRAPLPKSSATTMIVGEVDERDVRFNKNIQEMRELLLLLANVVGSVDSASNQAAKAFHTAKAAIDRNEIGEDKDLAAAQRLLVNEINRVIQSNATLHDELDKAHRGIEEQRRQIEELRVQARVDGLTRIPNRTAFDERLKEYVSLLDRSKLVFSLLLLDIDLFKQVNDQHGHLNGDRILRGVAARISASVRNNDFSSRYGGEEFAVIFPGADIDEAEAVAERIRADIAKTNFRMDDENIKVTVSGGLAECEFGMTGEALIKASDQALYRAKETGRNKIVIDRGIQG